MFQHFSSPKRNCYILIPQELDQPRNFNDDFDASLDAKGVVD